MRRTIASLVAAASFALVPLAAGEPAFGPRIDEPGAAVPTTAEIAAGRALRAEKPAPDVTFKDAEGTDVTLASLLEDGPVVLIFYRGGWCPYCVGQLKAFEKSREDVNSAGGRIVAVSTELPEFTAETRTKNRLGFPVLSDPNADASRAFGIAWRNDKYGKALSKFQGNEKGELPLGVTYVIDTDGTIAWAWLEDDYKKRATPDEAIAALEALD